MRKLLIVALLATAALTGAAACSTPAVSPSSSSTPSSGAGSASAADETKDVCTQAIAEEKQNAATILAKVNTALQAIANNQQPDMTQLGADLMKIQQQWITDFNGLAAKPIKPEVKTAITDFITYLQAINQDSNTADLTQVTTKFNQLDQALVAACA
jgi:hypothetical protein